MIRSYTAQAAINVKLTFRDRTVIFFNYLFPLVFFFIFAQLFHAEQGGAIIQVLTMVLSIGILGSGFFGAGIRAVQDREANILRRFKVAPISAAPMLVASLLTGLLNFLPSVLLMVLLSHFIYGMAIPRQWLSLLIFVALGAMAFRALGLIIASVVNSMQESQILIQLLYFPMLFLSGATIPISILPNWVQILAQFIPATYLMTGMQSILGRNETLAQNWTAAGALALTTVLGTFLGVKLFRWEKDEKIPGRAKLWLVAVFAPFLILGAYQARTKDSVVKARLLNRDLMRSRSLLIRDVRIFTGDGRVIESGGVLVKNGKIEHIYEGTTPDPKEVKAEAIEASGKTLLPGLIDVHVHLVAPGGFSESAADYQPDKTMPRALAAYLYSGITAVKSVGDPLDQILKVRALVNSGERLGAELFTCGPMFTASGGHGTEYFKNMPEQYRKSAEEQTVRIPNTAEEARQQVDELKRRGVDGIKAILEAGAAGMLFNRLDVSLLRAVAEEARARKLPIVVHTGDSHDVADALSAGIDGIEHGSMRDKIPAALFAQMKTQGVTYDPTLTVVEAFLDLGNGSLDPLERPLVLQAGPAALIDSSKKFLASANGAKVRDQIKRFSISMELAKQNLLAAWNAGVMLVTGSDAGNPLVLHGATIQRELELWVEAGIPPTVALQAGTYSAARLIGVGDRIGLIKDGYDANLLLVDGNPLKDIKQIESIQSVIFKGERISRSELFDQE
ncbi:MAG TPA: amidohydrolase family protein [Bryobacteraceae bacterium]|jgi:imidazolonepropionase-like amidohydrolase/ABC-type multidrug transport system permease subunit|nr:amidohydrolase family protein [Bryobacteraceae bacterium]